METRTVSYSFQSAPMGRRVIWSAIAVGAVTLAIAVVNIVLMAKAGRPPKAPVPVALSSAISFVPMLVATVSFLMARSRASSFSVEESVLVLGKKRFPLAGMTEAKRDPEVLRKAIKLWGNGGLGAIRGTFMSKRLGKFYAFLTDTEHAVVLRWPGKVVAVSPSDPEHFVHVAREAAGLK